ncbi:MAG: FAD/NAD(P)-binding protein [Ilumatobacteraceae bacterium]|jgi:NAD(P)H-flavin reductase
MDPHVDTVVAAVPPAGLADPLTPVPYRVIGAEPETADVVTLTLAPVTELLDPARPGQFMMVWAFGVGEIPVSVSAVGDGGEFGLTVRAVGAVSNAIVAARPGDTIGVRGPYGTAWPTDEAYARDVLVVAGGLGLAPLRTAIDELAAGGPRRLTVVVGAREPGQVLYPQDLLRWRRLGADVHVTVDAAPRRWDGAVGTATAVVARLGEHHDTVFVCGPELMMASAARAAIVQGTDPANVWVSLERNMHCGIAQCGRCQLGPLLLCRDGAVVRWDHVTELLRERGR